MDRHPQHWKSTLLGWDFWKSHRVQGEGASDGQPSEENTDPVAALGDQPRDIPQHKSNVHERFPFNQDLESELGTNSVEKNQAQMQEMHISKETKEPTKVTSSSKNELRKNLPKRGKRRHLSMSDIRSSILQSQREVTKPSSRFTEFGRRMRSPSPTKISAPANPVPSRNWLAKAPAQRLPFRSPLKWSGSPKITTVDAAEVPASPPSMPILAPSLPSRSTTPLPRPLYDVFPDCPVVESATPAKPLLEFQGGVAWSSFSRTRTTLGLDLFWPVNDEEEMVCLSMVEMRPLCQFRRLRSLKLVGMMQSYQTFIWQAAWLNLGLEELELGMALEPEIVSAYHKAEWRLIQGAWSMDEKPAADPVYYGHLGDGELHPNIGYGEYLDKHAIEKAKVRACAMGRTCRLLSIKSLILSGFVVDADPFLQWFDPLKLHSIVFKGQCVDAGFWLSRVMSRVVVKSPNTFEEPVPVGVVKMDLKELKVIELNGGKVVEDVPCDDE